MSKTHPVLDVSELRDFRIMSRPVYDLILPLEPPRVLHKDIRATFYPTAEQRELVLPPTLFHLANLPMEGLPVEVADMLWGYTGPALLDEADYIEIGAGFIPAG